MSKGVLLFAKKNKALKKKPIESAISPLKNNDFQICRRKFGHNVKNRI